MIKQLINSKNKKKIKYFFINFYVFPSKTIWTSIYSRWIYGAIDYK